jgi:hypothetical protein
MLRHTVFLALTFSLAVSADTKKPAPKPVTVQMDNDKVSIKVTPYLDRASVQQLIGSDLGPSIVVMEVTVTPKFENKVLVDRDDFLLLSFKDGQRSQPLAPSQVAGDAALVVNMNTPGNGGLLADNRGPVWGGAMGQPRRMGGNGGGIGNASSASGEAAVTGTTGGKDTSKPNPLLDQLKERVLANGETGEPVSGLLYFLLDGKHKPKDLEIFFKGPGGKTSVQFGR